MIPEATLSQIQDRLDIVEVVSAFVPLRRAGRNFKAPCPFHHEKTPSFMVSPDKQIFHCFGCGAGGNVFGFLMKAEKKDFLEVVESLAERTGVELPKAKPLSDERAKRYELFVKANALALDFYHQTLLRRPEASRARAYLNARGIGADAIESFKLGYAPDAWDSLCREAKDRCPAGVLENAGLALAKKEGGGHYDRFRKRIIFPILDAKGVCVAFGGRVLDDSLPKYLNSPETEIYTKGRHLYGLYQARTSIREKDTVIVVEGYMDLVACHQAGVTHVVASLGTALTSEQARLIKRHTRHVVILYDADKAGEMATLRGLEVLLEEGLEVKIVRLPEGYDPDSYVKQFGRERFDQALGAAQSLFDYKLAVLRQEHGDTLEGRVKTAGEMVDLFSKLENEILKSAWIKELSLRLSIPEDALVAEAKKAPGALKSFKEKGAELSGARPACETPIIERQVLGLVLESEEFLREARQAVAIEDFESAAIKKIFERVFGSPKPQAAELMNTFKEEPDVVRALALACAEAEAMADKRKCFFDCLAGLRRRRMLLQRQGIERELAAAQRTGDRSRIQQLMADFNELNKGMKKTHEKK